MHCSHSLEDALDCINVQDVNNFYSEKYHCDDPVCIKFLDTYYKSSSSITVPPLIPNVVPKVEDHMMLVPTKEVQRYLVSDGSVADVAYDADSYEHEVLERDGCSMLMVSTDKGYIDCVYSTLDSNLNRKPHHYRRSYAISRGVVMQKMKKTGDLCVMDSSPYNFGDIGGYYMNKPANRINVIAIRSGDKMKACVYSSGASGSKWQAIGDIQGVQNRSYEYDVFSSSVVKVAPFPGSYLDLANLQGVKMRIRDDVYIELGKGEYIEYNSFDIKGAQGVGMRQSLFMLFLQIPHIRAVMQNKGDNVVVELYARSSAINIIMIHVTRMIRYMGYDIGPINTKNRGLERIKIGIAILI